MRMMTDSKDQGGSLEGEGGAGIAKTIHGGAAPASHKGPAGSGPRKGRGAPKGNRNALKHGRYAREMRELRAFVSARLRAARSAIWFANHHARKKGEP